MKITITTLQFEAIKKELDTNGMINFLLTMTLIRLDLSPSKISIKNKDGFPGRIVFYE